MIKVGVSKKELVTYLEKSGEYTEKKQLDDFILTEEEKQKVIGVEDVRQTTT